MKYRLYWSNYKYCGPMMEESMEFRSVIVLFAVGLYLELLKRHNVRFDVLT